MFIIFIISAIARVAIVIAFIMVIVSVIAGIIVIIASIVVIVSVIARTVVVTFIMVFILIAPSARDNGTHISQTLTFGFMNKILHERF